MSSKSIPTAPKVAKPIVVVDESLSKSLEVDEGVVNEVLLVCGVIGTTKTKAEGGTADDDEGQLIPVTDCLLWLQDLQRALRRDDDAHRAIALLIGSWKIVQTKLLPLLKSAHYDSSIVVTILKILVILTKPLTATAKRAARMAIDVKGGKNKDAADRYVCGLAMISLFFLETCSIKPLICLYHLHLIP